MKRLFFCVFLSLLGFTGVAQEAIDTRVCADLVRTISQVKAPEVHGDYLIFTAEPDFRHVGIAFEFEDYKTIHSFSRISGENNKSHESLLFFIMQIPEDVSELRYRLVMDGLWTTDPQNRESFFDYSLGLSVSAVKVPYRHEYKTKNNSGAGVKFVYEGLAGQVIRLAGNFNNWDPFMYELNEVAPGKYELNLPLPKGIWIYAFFKGSTQIPDPTNHNTVYTAEGKTASVIVVK
ncbi:MAG: isoamylase [Treponema sp.]|nr:MAG: isoamylase [Treponema sp.]